MLQLDEWEWADIEDALDYKPATPEDRGSFREIISHIVEVALQHQVRELKKGPQSG